MEITAPQPTPKRRPRVLLWTVVSLLLASASALGWWQFRTRDKLDESCANCRKMIEVMLRQYARDHDGWYPRGGTTALDSLAKLVEYEHDVHHFTSHALSPQLIKYWKQHQTFAPDFTCYRYNEGLKADDLGNWVVLYFHQPTLWECNKHNHKGTALGRPVLLSPGPSWQFLEEEMFQKYQADTLRYLAEKGRLKKPAPSQ
ncbi:hypothetical protein LBMAG56_14960 [Verrucomicrobiota bacterium]|nr:hypothetical protein LBMAG56_14960 [Verrucomicrobiota bacterium]